MIPSDHNLQQQQHYDNQLFESIAVSWPNYCLEKLRQGVLPFRCSEQNITDLKGQIKAHLEGAICTSLLTWPLFMIGKFILEFPRICICQLLGVGIESVTDFECSMFCRT